MAITIIITVTEAARKQTVITTVIRTLAGAVAFSSLGAAPIIDIHDY